MHHRSPHLSSAGRAALAGLLAMIALAGCGGGKGDNGAIDPGPVPSGQALPPGHHEALPVTQGDLGSVRYPIVAGTSQAPALNAALLGVARSLVDRKVACAVSTLRADEVVVSFQWTCAGRGGATATYQTSTARRLTLDDVLDPGWEDQLSPTAVTQLRLGGASAGQAQSAAGPSEASFAEWGVDDTSLMVTFTVAGQPVTVSFPLTSLAPLLRPGGPLAPAGAA